MFKGPDGNPVSKELLLQRLKDHIFTVVKRYKGKIYAWDVVNEAVDDSNDTTQVYRKSNWYRICNGPDFIEAAFRYAHEADPKCKLFYNDYNSEQPVKREKIYKLLKKLVDDHVPIDGVGMQAHWKLYEPSPEELRKAIDEVTGLGLKVQFTELDITIRLPRRGPNRVQQLEQRRLRQIPDIPPQRKPNKLRNIKWLLTFLDNIKNQSQG